MAGGKNGWKGKGKCKEKIEKYVMTNVCVFVALKQFGLSRSAAIAFSVHCREATLTANEPKPVALGLVVRSFVRRVVE